MNEGGLKGEAQRLVFSARYRLRKLALAAGFGGGHSAYRQFILQSRHALRVDADAREAATGITRPCSLHSFLVVGLSIELPLRGGLIKERVNVLPAESPPSPDEPSSELPAAHILADRPGVKPKHLGSFLQRQEALRAGDRRVPAPGLCWLHVADRGRGGPHRV
jgi:hypothetical protein